MTLRILVADDSITIQKMIGLAFNHEDAEVKAVSSGDAVMESLSAFHPDIVLVDVCMPGNNGYQICEQIRNIPEFAGTPILFLVGAFEPFDEAEAARVRSNGHLVKPIDTSELIDRVHALVGEKTMISQDNGTNGHSGAEIIPELSRAASLGAVEEKVWASFTGPGQILELFDKNTLAAAMTMTGNYRLESETKIQEAAAMRAAEITDAIIDQVVTQVVKRMSPELIREVAWEVVPELSELLIRRVIEEQKQ
jgi:DNA-binding response OmpR family regulator